MTCPGDIRTLLERRYSGQATGRSAAMTPHKKECSRSQRQICDTVLVLPPALATYMFEHWGSNAGAGGFFFWQNAKIVGCSGKAYHSWPSWMTLSVASKQHRRDASSSALSGKATTETTRCTAVLNTTKLRQSKYNPRNKTWQCR